MKSFGFTITKGRLLDYNSNDHTLHKAVLAEEPSLALCIACGCCAATCMAGSHVAFSLRKMNIALRRGDNDLVRKEIDRCMLCGKCTLLCPMGVNTRNVICSIRKHIRILDGHVV